MNVILDNYPLPEQGATKIELSLTFEIRITAEQARKKVDRWLMEYVSAQMGGDPPTLVVGKRPVWRVPAYISYPHTGKAGIAGMVDVDVETGEMNNTPELEAEILWRAQEIGARQPPFKIKEVPPEYRGMPPVEILIVADDGQIKPAQK